MRSDLFSPQNAEAQMPQPGMKLQNGKMLKVSLNGEMLVRQGSMVAYQGNGNFRASARAGSASSSSSTSPARACRS